jgi:hypothetical protein
MKYAPFVAAAIAAFALALPAASPQGGLPPEVERLMRGGDDTPADLEAEMRALFAKVERALRRIDDKLFEAGAGDALSGDLHSGLGDLLDRTLTDSRNAVRDIDRILEIASQMSQQQQSSSGGSSGDPQDGQSQSQRDGRRPPPRQGQENTPENPDERLDPGANQPQSSGSEQQQQQGEGQGEQPLGGEGRGEDQQQGELPASQRGEPAQPGTGTDPWGDLPPRVQAIFRTQGGADMPPAYRGWIDAYHRRLGRTGR